MQKGIKLNYFIISGCVLVVSLTGITSLVDRHTSEEINTINNNLIQTHNLKSELRFLLKILVDAETGQRGFIITKSNEYLGPFNDANENIEQQFNVIQKTISDRKDVQETNLNIQQELDVIKSLSKQKIQELEETINFKRIGKEQELLNLILSNKGKIIMDNIRKRLDAILAAEDKILAEQQEKLKTLEDFSYFLDWGLFVCIVVMVTLVCIAIILPDIALMRSLQNAFNLTEEVAAGNLTVEVQVSTTDAIGKLMAALKRMTEQLSKLIRKVQQSGIQVTSSATQIASSGKQLEASITEQLASTNEVTVTAKQISATARELLNTVEEVTTMSQATTIAANDSRKNLQQMEATMQQLVEATNSIASRLGVISEKANNINNIVITITKVADQTNLLSLNAAIEAEKAGEYGLGFAVVAREIRRLADQTALATIDIEQMVKQMQSSVSTGVMEMDKFATEVTHTVEDVRYVSKQVEQIIEQVQELTPRYELVNQGMDAQAQGAQQISDSMSQLSVSASQTANALKEINHSIVQLNEVAQGLHQEMTHFQLK